MRIFRQGFLALLFGLFLAGSMGFAVELPPEVLTPQFQQHFQFADFERGARAILARYPSEQYTYASMGGSPIGLALTLRLLVQEDAVVLLPLSGLNSPLLAHSNFMLRTDELFLFDKNVRRYCDELFAHFIPQNGKKILLMDFAATGVSLVRGGALLADYLRRNKMLDRLSILALDTEADYNPSPDFVALAKKFDALN